MSKSDISLHDVAEMLDVHYMTVYRYVRQGQLPATKVGRSWYVKPSDLELFRDAKAHSSEVSEGGKKNEENRNLRTCFYIVTINRAATLLLHVFRNHFVVLVLRAVWSQCHFRPL